MEITNRDEVGSLELWLYECSGIGTGQDGARQLIDVLLKAGGQFVEVHSAAWHIVPEPTKLIAAGGSLPVTDFVHPLLRRTLLEPVSLREFPASCSASYEPHSRTVRFSQSASQDDPGNLDAIARGLLALAEALYPALGPRLAFVDEASDSLDENKILWEPLARSLSAQKTPYLFWANILSPALVEEYGPEFLLAAPGWRMEKLSDGAVLYVATRRYFRWWTGPPRKIMNYFGELLPSYNTDYLIAGPTTAPPPAAG